MFTPLSHILSMDQSPDISAIGAKIIDQMTGQSDLLQSLAVAVCGGTLALLWTLVQHHQTPAKNGSARPVVLQPRWCIWLGLSLVGCSTLFAYSLRGYLVDQVPHLMTLPYAMQKSFDEMKCIYSEGRTLARMAFLQWLFFTAGTLMLAYCFLRTFLKLLPGKEA